MHFRQAVVELALFIGRNRGGGVSLEPHLTKGGVGGGEFPDFSAISHINWEYTFLKLGER
jgi:hypothetical protein